MFAAFDFGQFPESDGTALNNHEKELSGAYMKSNSKRDVPEIVLRQGKPSAVILDIDQYQQMLEKIEDVEDLEMLKKLRKKPLKFRKLEDFLKEYSPDV